MARQSQISWLLREAIDSYTSNTRRFLPEYDGLHLRRLLEIGEAFDANITATWDDPDLTSIGQRKKIETIARDTLTTLVAFETDVIVKLTERIAAKERAILAPFMPAASKTDGDRIVAEMRHAEIRAQLRSLTREQRSIIYATAIERGDMEIADAIDNAPPEFTVDTTSGPAKPYVSFIIDTNVSGRLARARGANPEAARELQGLVNLRDLLRDIVAQLKEGVSTESNVQDLHRQFTRV